MSGCANKTPANATLILHPPENSWQGRDCAEDENPRPDKIEAALASAEYASMSANLPCISAMRFGSVATSASSNSAVRSVSADRTVSNKLSSDAGASCAIPPIRIFFGISIFPSSKPNSFVMSLNRVVLPVPFLPTIPTL